MNEHPKIQSVLNAQFMEGNINIICEMEKKIPDEKQFSCCNP